jgi:transposase
MDLTPMHKRVIALDVHQAKITACAVVEHDDGRVEVTKRDFGAFKRDRRALAQWRWRYGPRWWSWRARACTGRARLRRSRR